MVAAHNLNLDALASFGRVGVFVGATSGIGASTLEVMVERVSDSTFYVLGRSKEKFAPTLAHLERLCPTSRVIFIQAEVTLIADVDAACKVIAAQEKQVDFLCMSAGLIPVNGREDTKEGLEKCFAISYYARMRALVNLLPLLRASPRPRILSILNGTREKKLIEDDLGLDNPANWSPFAVVNHTTTLTSATFERFAKQEPKVTFMHAFPGLVKTDIFARLTPTPGSGFLRRFMVAAIRSVVGTLMFFLGMTAQECGERQAWLLLNQDRFGPGLAWRIDEKGEPAKSRGWMATYGSEIWKERIWDHTVAVFERATMGY